MDLEKDKEKIGVLDTQFQVEPTQLTILCLKALQTLYWNTISTPAFPPKNNASTPKDLTVSIAVAMKRSGSLRVDYASSQTPYSAPLTMTIRMLVWPTLSIYPRAKLINLWSILFPP
jgi:hypothetical protein